MKTLTKEERDLLLKELCSRLPYGLMANIPLVENDKRVYKVTISWLKDYIYNNVIIFPYLRPLISMTNEEALELNSINPYDHEHSVDFYNKYHFDYRGLIPMGLAIEVTDENNPYKNQ